MSKHLHFGKPLPEFWSSPTIKDFKTRCLQLFRHGALVAQLHTKPLFYWYPAFALCVRLLPVSGLLSSCFVILCLLSSLIANPSCLELLSVFSLWYLRLLNSVSKQEVQAVIKTLVVRRVHCRCCCDCTVC